MAKKKTAETANIKAAPVLRSSGDDPTPETPVITKSYCVRDDWKDQDKVNYVAFKSVDGEVQDLTVNGEPAGGGGSTATVTFINSSNSKVFEIKLTNISSETGIIYVDNVILSASETKTVTVPLGPGGYFAQFGGKGDFPENGTATGGVRYDKGDVFITGDGTLTVA